MANDLPCARGGTALLIIDMLNDMDFAEGEDLLEQMEAITPVIANLRDAAEQSGVPVIFVNDNFGQWHSERSRILDYVAGTRGAAIARALEPREGDYFVIKPEVSGFYATSLATLLPRLSANRLILTGVAADICVLFTAADAHMRDYELWVPRDAVASEEVAHRDWALRIMEKSMAAVTTPSGELDLSGWVDRA